MYSFIALSFPNGNFACASSTPRRKPRTLRHSLRSSRKSPPRFGEDNVDDGAADPGSPLPLDNAGFGFDFDNFSELDTEEPSLLSLNEKQEAIVETLRKIVPKYWDTLQQVSFSHARL